MLLLLHLVRNGHLTDHEFVRAVDTLVRSQLPLGQFCLQRGILSAEQVSHVLTLQSDEDRPFGELAVEAGLLTPDQLRDLLMAQIESRIDEVELLELLGLGDRRWLEDQQRQMRGPAIEADSAIRLPLAID